MMHYDHFDASDRFEFWANCAESGEWSDSCVNVT